MSYSLGLKHICCLDGSEGGNQHLYMGAVGSTLQRNKLWKLLLGLFVLISGYLFLRTRIL